MNIDINNSTVIVAPLNWGLGHAARCVPVINKLLANNCTVIIASDGNALQFLKTAFPLLQYYELPGYNIQYPANKKMTTSLLWQFLLVPNTIKKSTMPLQKLLQSRNLNTLFRITGMECFIQIVPISLSHIN
ncbi:MAG: hypothetical protein IPP29_17215 [Bacteroidetes bacterium]|nr:hypothetical protein [Bacteroidota bacterium]